MKLSRHSKFLQECAFFILDQTQHYVLLNVLAIHYLQKKEHPFIKKAFEREG